MCGVICSVATIIVGAALVVGSCVLSFVFIPDIIRNVIISETVLRNDTIQLERFEEVPFPLNFTVRVFNLSNAQDVLNGGVPFMTEIGPYVYRLYQSRELLGTDEDTITYRRHERFEFDAIASYPNTQDDMVTIINVPYHAIIQVAESSFPSLLAILNLAMNGIFGEYNSPIATVKVQDLLFNGLPICKNAGLVGGIACNIIKEIAQDAQNIEEQEDGSLAFSILSYKERYPSADYKVLRGIDDSTDLGRIIAFDAAPYFSYWTNWNDDDVSVCNKINGTDSGIFAPFIDREKNMYAINTDICRSVELRYQFDTEYEGIPTARYAANEWLLDNDDGCFCLNVTSGINREDGCLLRGAMELYSCVGAFLVMSYPHFLYADETYRNGVLGMRPNEENHKIFMDIEPNTGTPVRGAKRAQFNIFMRPVTGIPPTQSLRTSLVPFIWVEESIALPDEFVSELTDRLLSSLRLVDILIPVLIAVCCAVLLLGVALTIRTKCRKPNVRVLSNGVPIGN